MSHTKILQQYIIYKNIVTQFRYFLLGISPGYFFHNDTDIIYYVECCNEDLLLYVNQVRSELFKFDLTVHLSSS